MEEQKQQYGWIFAARSSLQPEIAQRVRLPINILLWAFRTRAAPLEHEKIYALLSLVDEDIPMVSDYRKSTKAVYSELAQVLTTRETNSTFPLDHVGFTHCVNHTRCSKLPSWVTNLKGCRHGVQFLDSYDPWIPPFRADDHILDQFPYFWNNESKSRYVPPKLLEIFIQAVRGWKLGHTSQKCASCRPVLCSRLRGR